MAPATPKREVTVYKLDEKGREVWHYPARVLQRDAQSIRLEAFFDRPSVDLGSVVFNRGDRFVETFYEDRWYNIFAVYDRDTGRLKGWYANVCRPAEIGDEAVRCEDLALDVWISAEGEITVLDREEYDAIPLTARERVQGQQALAAIVSLARQGELPV